MKPLSRNWLILRAAAGWLLILVVASGLLVMVGGRLEYVNKAFGVAVGCDGCFHRSVLLHDLSYLAAIFLTLLLGFRIRRRYVSIPLRFAALSGTLVYGLDVAVSREMSTRLRFGDILLFSGEPGVLKKHMDNTGLLGGGSDGGLTAAVASAYCSPQRRPGPVGARRRTMGGLDPMRNTGRSKGRREHGHRTGGVAALGRGRRLALLLVAGLAAGSTGADDFVDLVRHCESCHGPDGVSVIPVIPIIAGFSHEGFLNTMDVFRDDDRIALRFQIPGEPETVMNEIARALGDEDVEALATYFSQRPFVAAKQDYDARLADRGEILHKQQCERCHTDNGAYPVEDAAILAGQWTPYLRRQFDNILSGKRMVPRSMYRRVNKLSPEDIEALLHFYASQGRS